MTMAKSRNTLPLILSRRRASIHRSEQNRHLREMCAGLAPKTVLNLGAEPSAPDKEGSTYRDYFPGAVFKAMDQRPHDDPDYVEGNLMEPMPQLGQFDLVLCMSVIEHIDRPWVAAPNIAGLVAPGGHLYVSMPWIYPTHEGPDFGDHWRARPSGLRILFEMLEEVSSAFHTSSLAAVTDRKTYWRTPDSTASGSSVLFHKPE